MISAVTSKRLANRNLNGKKLTCMVKLMKFTPKHGVNFQFLYATKLRTAHDNSKVL